MRHDQEQNPGLAGLFLLVFKADQAIGGKRHHLPGDQEEERVRGGEDERQTGEQNIVEEPQNADSGSRRTVQENSETPQGRFQFSFAPCARAIPEAASSSKAPSSASPKARRRAPFGHRIETRLAAAPARYAINPKLKSGSSLGTFLGPCLDLPGCLLSLRFPCSAGTGSRRVLPQNLVHLRGGVWRPLDRQNQFNLIVAEMLLIAQVKDVLRSIALVTGQIDPAILLHGLDPAPPVEFEERLHVHREAGGG